MKKSSLILSVVLFFNFSLLAQINFEDNSYLLSLPSNSSFAMGMCDIDGDFRDDISLIAGGNDLRVYLQSAALGSWDIMGKTTAFPQEVPWTFCAGDLNNDGFKEIVIAGQDKGLYIYDLSKNDPLVQYIDDIFFSQATNFVDINNDGWLDMLACNDLGDNYIYINDQTGKLVFMDNLINWGTQPVSDNSGNYSSEWVDYDNDHDLDLSIVKCRADVQSIQDPRRINMLFRNDGNGNFVNVAASTNFDVPYQSWSHNWGDIDNDGDLDCYVINHDRAHFILINNGNGSFVINEDIVGAPFYGSGAIQSILYDLDNDTDLDVLITGARDHILWNNGSGSFTDEDVPFQIDDIFSAAIGDINQDGFADILVSNNGIVDNIGTEGDYLFSAIPNSNNYCKISLQGTQSNRDAIGATIYLHGPWGVQRRDIRAGESYSIVNSSNVNFGLNNHNQIDSVEIFWPSGLRESYPSLLVNKQYLAIENNCFNVFEDISIDGSLQCIGDEVTLSVLTGGVVTWSNGQVGPTLLVSAPGDYSAKIELGGDCVTFTKMVYIEGSPSLTPPNIQSNTGFAFCQGSSLEISIEDYDNISWSNGSKNTVLTVFTEGWHAVTVSIDNCPDEYIDSTYVELVSSPVPDFLGDTLDMEGNVSIFAFADSIHWFETEWSSDLIFKGNNLQNFETKSRKYFAEAIYHEKYPSLSFEQDPPLDAADVNVNDGLFFKVLQNCIVNSVSVVSAVEGIRTIELRDDLGTVLQSKTVMIPQSMDFYAIPLNFSLSAGVNYLLTTNTNDNVQNLGTVSPRLLIKKFNNTNSFPFVIPDYLEISAAKDDLESFPYFFEWQIDQGYITCQSERVGVPIVIAGVSSLDVLDQEEIEVLPNPVSNQIYLKSEVSDMVSLKLFSLYGAELLKVQCKTNEWIDLKDIATGVYVLSYSLDKKQSWKSQKLVKL